MEENENTNALNEKNTNVENSIINNSKFLENGKFQISLSQIKATIILRLFISKLKHFDS